MCIFPCTFQRVLRSPLTLLYKEVKRISPHEMSALASGCESEVLGSTGNRALVGETDSEALAAPSQAQPPKDNPSNSGENFLVS